VSRAKADQVNLALFKSEPRIFENDYWCAKCRSIAAVGISHEESTTEMEADANDVTYVEHADYDSAIASLCQSLKRSLNPPINYQPLRRPVIARDRYRADVLRQLANAFSREEVPKSSEDLQADSEALGWIMTRLGEKYKVVNYAEKRSLLTLVPPQLSYETIRARAVTILFRRHGNFKL